MNFGRESRYYTNRVGKVHKLLRVQNPPTPCPLPDKGTTAWHGISAAGAVFPSASVNGQARCIALTPFVPLSRLAGEGERAAGRTAARSYTPLPQRGRGAGGEGENSASVPHAANPSAVPLSNLQEAVLACPCFNTNRAGGVYNCPPPLGSPRFARGTAKGAPTRFPLLAGGTLRRGLSGILVFVNFGCAIGINCPPPLGSPRFARGTKPIGSPCVQGEPYGGGYRAYSFL